MYVTTFPRAHAGLYEAHVKNLIYQTRKTIANAYGLQMLKHAKITKCNDMLRRYDKTFAQIAKTAVYTKIPN